VTDAVCSSHPGCPVESESLCVRLGEIKRDTDNVRVRGHDASVDVAVRELVEVGVDEVPARDLALARVCVPHLGVLDEDAVRPDPDAVRRLPRSGVAVRNVHDVAGTESDVQHEPGRSKVLAKVVLHELHEHAVRRRLCEHRVGVDVVGHPELGLERVVKEGPCRLAVLRHLVGRLGSLLARLVLQVVRVAVRGRAVVHDKDDSGGASGPVCDARNVDISDERVPQLSRGHRFFVPPQSLHLPRPVDGNDMERRRLVDDAVLVSLDEHPHKVVDAHGVLAVSAAAACAPICPAHRDGHASQNR
jgi:hypothetical protein